MSSLSSRVTGYPSFYKATTYIYEKFLEYGLSYVQYHNYTITVPIDCGANITILSSEGKPLKVIEAYSLWPNGAQACPTPPGGLIGELVYVGDGEYASFNGKNVSGNIVLMDFNSRRNWLNALNLGAKAVIFIEPPETTRYEAELKYVSAPLYFPRLLVKEEDGLYLKSLANKGIKVRVCNSMRYERKNGVNVIAFLNGSGLSTNPELSREVVILGAKYDSISVVPALAPGADEAVGIAVLLELAAFLKNNPPARSVMFVAVSGHGFGLEGVRWFVEDLFFQNKWADLGLENNRLFIGLELSSETPTLCGLLTGHFYKFYDGWAGGVGGIGWVLGAIQRYTEEIKNLWTKIYGRTWDMDFSPRRQQYWWAQCKSPFMLISEPYHQAGSSGFSYFTYGSWRLHYNTWLDTYEKVDFENIRPQVEFIFFTISSLLNEPEIKDLFSARYRFQVAAVVGMGLGFGKLIGRIVEYNPLTGRYDPVPHALVHIWQRKGPGQTWYKHEFIIMTDENGTFAFVGYAPASGGGYTFRGASGWYTVRAYVVNGTNILYGPDFGDFGSKEYPDTFLVARGEYGSWEYPRYFVVFKCGTIVLLNAIDIGRIIPLFEGLDPRSRGVASIMINDVRTHFPPRSYGYAAYDNILMVFTPPDTPIEIVTKFADIEIYPFNILLNLTQGTPQGFVVRAGETLYLENDALLSAVEMHKLNYERLGLTENLNVFSISAREYFFAADNFIKEAMSSLEEKMYDKYISASISAWQNARKAYIEIRTLLDGVINSTVFFFILLIPFAFLWERLIFSVSSWKYRFSIIMGSFAVLVFILYFVHPGFRLASNIFMVLIGFVTFVLTVPLIVFLIAELLGLAKELREKIMGLHFVGISRSAAITSAFSIGVSNMRRRRFRTTLTLLSIGIVTMSFVTFTSLFNFTLVRITGHPVAGQYVGMELRRYEWSWSEYPSEYLISYIRCSFPENAVSFRVWLSSPDIERGMEVSGKNGKKMLFSILGLDPLEEKFSGFPEKCLMRGRWFIETDRNVALIPNSLARYLGVDLGDSVRVMGHSFQIIGIYDESIANTLTDLDEELITPLDPRVPEMYKVHVSSDEIIIVPARFLLEIGGVPQVINIKFTESDPIVDLARDLVKRIDLAIWASTGENLYILSRAAGVEVQGWQFTVVPLLIACLTILNMSFASVVERTKEISIFSLVGLAPMHVAGMFLAESIIYSIISGVLGYVLGVVFIQFAFIFNLYPPGFYPNYSSNWIIIGISLMMVATIASSSYPAYKASRLVTPSLERKWKITTKPVGDEWSITFPFLIPREEINGMIKFLLEYIDDHKFKDSSNFIASEVKYEKEIKDDIESRVISMRASIEPYEDGVSQDVVIKMYREKDQTRYRLTILLKRLQGEHKAWVRNNPRFIDLIRKQILIWSSLSPQDKMRYLSESPREGGD
ncbi:MAG: FtsX-like permease family protein [Candidatus Bathyarchaeia archaeon]